MKVREGEPPICGTAHATMSRISSLREAAERLVIRVALDGERLVVEIDNPTDASVADVNVHHGATPNGGFPFLASALGVTIPAGGSVRLELAAAGRDAPFHIVLQSADAFAWRTVS